MARGAEGATALDMSKFFDTNYHYMVSDDLLVHTRNPRGIFAFCLFCAALILDLSHDHDDLCITGA